MKPQFACRQIRQLKLTATAPALRVREAPGRGNPAAPEDGKGRPRQFMSRISFPSESREGFRDSIMARLRLCRSELDVARAKNRSLLRDWGAHLSSVLWKALPPNGSRPDWRPAGEMTCASWKPHSF